MPSANVSISKPVHWSKDFVEHLRLVHFALVAVSVGLILLVLSAKSYNPATALRQVQEIILLQKSWSPQWLLENIIPSRDNVAAFYSLNEAKEARYPSVERSDNIRITYKPGQHVLGTVYWKRGSPQSTSSFVFVFPESSLVMPRWLSAQDSILGNQPDPFLPGGVPQTLSGFHTWWDILQRPSTVDIPTEVCPTGGIIGENTVIGDAQHKNLGSFVVLSENSTVDSPANLQRVELLVGRPSDSRQIGYIGDLPTKKKEQAFFAFGKIPQLVVNQEKLTKLFPNWHPGSFDTTFRDLDRAGHELGVLDLMQVKTIISDDAPKGVEVFEVFGMKLPSALINSWGPVIVLAVQLYFFVYLRQLSGNLHPDDAGWDVPWIGMDQSSLARIMFFATLVLLPAIALTFLGGRDILQMTADYRDTAKGLLSLKVPIKEWGSKILESILFLIVGLISALVLGCLSWKYRPRIKQEPSYSCPSQLFE